jgi:hypothetical protein
MGTLGSTYPTEKWHMVCLRDHHLAFSPDHATSLVCRYPRWLVGRSLLSFFTLKGLKERDMLVGHHMSQDPPGKGANWSYCRPCSCSARFTVDGWCTDNYQPLVTASRCLAEIDGHPIRLRGEGMPFRIGFHPTCHDGRSNFSVLPPLNISSRASHQKPQPLNDLQRGSAQRHHKTNDGNVTLLISPPTQ